MTETILFKQSDGIATVTFNRPSQRNAVNAEMCERMVSIFDNIETDDAIRVTILTGTGNAFCAGMDLKAFQDGQATEILFGFHGFAGFVKRERTKPVIAAVNGAAMAGGFELMLACDLAVASSTAIFGLPEPRLGLFAGGGGAIRLPNRIPRVQANEMLLTGQPISAERALHWGLLNDITDGDVVARAKSIAKGIVANAPQSIISSLALSNLAGQQPVPWDASDAALARIIETPDCLEGIQAFCEARPPKWQDD